jgi:hypothetical protein
VIGLNILKNVENCGMSLEIGVSLLLLGKKILEDNSLLLV